MKRTCLIAAAALSMAAGSTCATTITFEDLAEGEILGSQYAALGVVFSPNAFSGSNNNSSSDPWATNTGMRITSTDFGTLGLPALLSGNVLHSFGDWLAEDGDPSILATFSTPITSISVDFGGVFTGIDTTLSVYDGSTLLGSVAAPSCGTTCQVTLAFTAPSITRVAFAPGSFDDWVAIDNITFTTAAVAEPGSLAIVTLGLGLLALGGAGRRQCPPMPAPR